MEGSIIFNRAYTLVWLCFAGLALRAEATDLPQIEFVLKPRLCVLSEAEEACFDEVEIRWTADKGMNLCLYRDSFDAPLKCWQEAEQGSHHLSLSASRNITFQLRDSGQAVMVSESFEVINDHKKYRRQRRNPWSFF